MFKNMTPHVLNVIMADGKVMTLPPSGNSVRVSQTFEPVAEVEGVKMYSAKYGEVETIDNATKNVVGGLPPVVEGIVYIVSGQALEAVKASRTDFAAPGELIRDEKGQPVGCNGLKV